MSTRIVLNLGDSAVALLIVALERNGGSVSRDIVDLVKQQWNPRIEEPGLWGVVQASLTNEGTTQPFLRDSLSVNCGGGWVSIYGPPETSLRRIEWDDLIDPVLVREGVTP